MSPNEIIREAWEMYKRHWRHLIPIAFVVYALLSLFTLLLAALLDDWVAALAGFFITIAGAFWVQGALVEAVADVRDGRADLTLSETLERVGPRVNTLGAAGILAAFGIGIGFIFLIIPGLVLMTIWSLIVPAIMLERLGVMEAFGRSRELVRGQGWNVFGVIVLTILILIVISIVVAIAFIWLDDTIQDYVVNVISSSVTAPFLALAWTLMYYRLRGEREPAAA